MFHTQQLRDNVTIAMKNYPQYGDKKNIKYYILKTFIWQSIMSVDKSI